MQIFPNQKYDAGASKGKCVGTLATREMIIQPIAAHCVAPHFQGNPHISIIMLSLLFQGCREQKEETEKQLNTF